MPSVLKVNEVQSDTDLPLVFNVGNAERGRIDTSGNMGLGTTSPIAKLHVVSGASTGVFANSNAGQAHFYGTDGTAAIGLYANNSTGNQIYWGGSDILRFVNVSTERARFNSTGAFVFNGGTTTADGIGITFPATQSASSNANTLDDYEEGNWTPEFNSSVAGTGRVTSNTLSRYIKIGKLVYVTSYATLSTLGTGGSGNWVLKGLPFTSSTTVNAHFSVSVGYFDSLNGNVNYITGTVQPGSNEILFRGTTGATNTITNFAFSTYMAAGSSVIVSGCYEANV